MKIGQEKHIDELKTQGKLFCNPIKYFRKIEGTDKNRRDEREGAFKTELIKPESLIISIDGEKLPITFTRARLNKFNSTQKNYKLYCLFAFKNKHITGEPFIDERNTEFGNKALIITNTEEFVNRIENKLNGMNLEYSYDFVTYYEEKMINDKLSIFHKPQEFAYQSEFRFFIKDLSPDPLIFKIGSIEDISIDLYSEDLQKLSLRRNEI